MSKKNLTLMTRLLDGFMVSAPVGAMDHIYSGNIHGFNSFTYANSNPYKFIDPDGNKGKVGWVVKLVSGGMKRLGRVSLEQAQKLRRQGYNIEGDSKKLARQIEKGAFRNSRKTTTSKWKDALLKHDGDPLKDGSGKVGAPHYQTEGEFGHTFWGVAGLTLIVVADTLDGVAEAADALDPTSYITSGDSYMDPYENIVDYQSVIKNPNEFYSLPKEEQERIQNELN